ncbi:MAG TPA: efflux RND transporter permease subunit [Aggregatilineales bacterium]|nr:efflux RND transporter permease subunit [Aggregatilineales bacterium]
MNIAEGFIRRPVMTTLVMSAILLFGVMGYLHLPMSDLPNVDFPTLLVSASLPGATPDTMASAVAQPLERQFSTIAGLDSMTSTSSQGSTQITLQFNLTRNIDAAAQDVQAMIAKAARDLPQNMPSPPSYQKVNPADQPVLYISLNSPTLRLSDVDEYAETLIAQRVSMVSGVAQVQVLGAQKYSVRVSLDPRELASRQVGIDEVAQAIDRGNVNLPTGILYGSNQAFTVQATGQLNKAVDYAPLIVTYRNGAPVRLADVGTVRDGVENDKTATWYFDKEFGQRRAIMLAIQRQPGTNTVEVVDNIRQLLPSFKEQMPPSVRLNILYDRSVSIRDSITDVKFTLFLALILVIMVIFLFLRNLSATTIPSLALPLSLIGTFAVMYLLGYSLDNLSLMALTLCVGFVVDDAIVVLENIVRHMEMGEPAMEAALRGSKEIGFTIVSMTFSLASVFIPVLFMSGLVGRLLHEFAVTIGAAILVSGFVSLSLTPMLCSRFLREGKEAHHGRLWQITENFFNGLLRFYQRTLAFTLHHRLATFGVSVLVLAGTVVLFMKIPAGFLPDEDQGFIFVFTEGPQGISFDSMVRHQLALNDIVQKLPWVDSYNSTVATGNQGRIFIHMVDRKERKPAIQLVQELRAKLTAVPGINAFPQMLPTIRIGGQLTKSQYQFTMQSPDTKELYEVAPKFEARLRQDPRVSNLLQDVTSDLLIKNPQVNVEIDRDRASTLGITAEQVEDALYTAYGQRQISTIYAPSNTYRVITELRPQYQADPSVLSMLYVRSMSGQLVPLNAVAKFTPTLGPLTINHLGQLPSVTVSFNLRPGIALGQAVDGVNRVASEMLPQDISTSFQGTAQAFQSSQSGLGVLLIMAIAVIYLVLGILYESFIHPLTILSGLPSAGFGALLTLMLFKVELSLYAFVGVIMLVGIVKKNAIMMIDVALEKQRSTGESPADAIYQGALLRFRPIMMTTMAALMGTLPVALGLGAGAESRRPLGLAVVGGLVFSQMLTLYITPVYYVYLDRVEQWFKSGRRRKTKTMDEISDRDLVASDAHD